MIEDILPRYQETANGTKKSFTLPFDVIDSKYIMVYMNETKQTSGFSINNQELVFDSVPAAGTIITAVRVIPIDWEDYNYGALDIDKIVTFIVAKMQTLEEQIDRSLKVNIYDDSTQTVEFFLQQLADAQSVLQSAQDKLNLITSTGNSAITNINNAKEEAVQAVNEQVTAAESAAESASASATSAKATLGSVETARDDAINTFNKNVTTKTNEYNNNATVKLDAYNSNADSRTTIFNTNAQTKMDSIDASVKSAAGSASAAAASAKEAAKYTVNIVQNLDSPSSDSVPSTKAVSDAVNTKVNKSGDTMTGNLVTSGVLVANMDNIGFIARSKSLVKGTTPTDSNKYVGYDWQDKNGQRLVYLGVKYGTDGTKRLELQKIDSNLTEFDIDYPIRNAYSFYFQDTQHTLGNVDVNTWIGNQIQFRDSKATRLARVQPLLVSDGTSRLCLAASKGLESERSIVIGSDGYTSCPKPADTSNGYAIATTNWAGGLNRSNTWTGLNTFNVNPVTSKIGNARYNCVCTGYTKGTAPTAIQFGGVSTYDKNNVELATIYSSIDTNNTVTSALWVKQPTASGTTAKAISIYCDTNGNFHTSCSVPSAENNSILTTLAHGDNYVKLGNGLILQWGNNTTNNTITLPTPFTGSYSVTANQTSATSNTNNLSIENKTTTSFYCRKNGINTDFIWIAIGY